MARNLTASRRFMPPITQDFSNVSWAVARRPLHEILLWLIKYVSGVPGGFKDIPPNTIQAGETADAGNGNSVGWMAADATFHVNTAAPNDLTLGLVSFEGAGAPLVRASANPDTIGLAMQVENYIMDRC